jgi:hypothetical protein
MFLDNFLDRLGSFLCSFDHGFSRIVYRVGHVPDRARIRGSGLLPSSFFFVMIMVLSARNQAGLILPIIPLEV